VKQASSPIRDSESDTNLYLAKQCIRYSEDKGEEFLFFLHPERQLVKVGVRALAEGFRRVSSGSAVLDWPFKVGGKTRPVRRQSNDLLFASSCFH